MVVRRILPGIAAAAVLHASAAAWAVAPVNPNDINAKMEALEAKVQAQQEEIAQLRGAQSDTWLNARRVEEVKSLVREVLADADTRASLLSNGLSAGHNGKNFFLASEDGTFLLKFSGQVQARYTGNIRNYTGVPISNTSSSFYPTGESGFSIPRAKLAFDGFIGDPKLEYKFQISADRKSTAEQLEDAWIRYALTDNIKIWGGRFSDTFARESINSSKYTQTVDRSAVANIFSNNDNYVEGIGIEWKPTGDLKLSGTLNDGLGSGNKGSGGFGKINGGAVLNTGVYVGTGASQDFQADNTDFALTGRVDAKVSGAEWTQADDVEAWSNIGDDLYLFTGGGVHYEQAKSQVNNAILFSTTGPITAVYSRFLEWTVDATLKYQGLSLFASVYGLHIQDKNGLGAASLADTNNYAAVVQGGYFVIPDKLEPFVRYEYINVSNKYEKLFSSTLANDQHLLTFGGNYFFRKHSAKFTLDAVWALNNVNALNTLGYDLSGIGLLTDSASGLSNSGRGQVAIRAQFQLLF